MIDKEIKGERRKREMQIRRVRPRKRVKQVRGKGERG
jgi:hypothetical protein